MTSIPELLETVKSYATPELVAAIGVGSVAMVVVSAVLTPFALARIPTDYFKRDKPHIMQRLRSVGPVGALALIAKNLAGVLLVLAGLIMIVTPGQGTLTALIGLALIDFPGKQALERRLLRAPKVLDTINWCRRKAGRPPLEL